MRLIFILIKVLRVIIVENVVIDYCCAFLLQAEVNYLGQLRHPNLVKLIGYSCEDDHRLLVYEYMASGSLEKHLFFRKWLWWRICYCVRLTYIFSLITFTPVMTT